MTSKPTKEKLPPLEQGLLEAMQALDNQIARRMERSPAEREVHGVQKWEPYQTKIEEVTALVMQAFGEESVKLDSLLILTQAFVKSLYLLTEELGVEGLGELRAAYTRTALELMSRDVHYGLSQLGAESQVN